MNLLKENNINTIISVEDRPREDQPNVFYPLLNNIDLYSPRVLIYFALMVVLLVLSSQQKQEKVLGKAQFATPRDVMRARRRGLKQIAKGSKKNAAFQLENLVLSDIQPAIALVGKSGIGKTRSVADPAIKNAIDQGWTNLIFDVKGEFIRKHAAYALSQGYEVYIYAPGYPYSDGLNFLEFMKDHNDAKTAEEIAVVLEANFGTPGERKDGFFSPQGVALLRLVFMMAKASPHKDLLSSWKYLSLSGLAKRLKTAHEYDLFDDLDFGLWIGEASSALRSMEKSDRTVESIIGTSMTNFQRMIDPSIVPCLINHTIPINLSGKQMVFFQIDENAKSATSPLVAAAIHMLVTRNLNASVKRKKSLGLFLDEFDSISLPDIKDYITKMRSYGLVALLSYQSDSQVEFRYTRAYADSVLSSCGTKIYFDTGHTPTAQKVSQSLGKKQVQFDTTSRRVGGKSDRNISGHIQAVPLIEADEINQQGTGEALITNAPGLKKRPYKTKIKIDKKNDLLWDEEEGVLPKIWFDEIKPYREEQLKSWTEYLGVEIKDREVLAECNLPSVEALKIMGLAKNFAENQQPEKKPSLQKT